MISAGHVLLAVAGLAAFFGAVIATSIRAGDKRRAAALRDTTAERVWHAAGQPFPIADLLYGIWQISMHEVRLVVRDGENREIGNVVDDRGRIVVTVDDEMFEVVPGTTWNRSSDLVALDNGSIHGPVAHFQMEGWGTGRIAHYTADGLGRLTLKPRFSFPSVRQPLPIYADERPIGWIAEIGSNLGRAISLPAYVPDAVKLYILWEAAGTTRR